MVGLFGWAAGPSQMGSQSKDWGRKPLRLGPVQLNFGVPIDGLSVCIYKYKYTHLGLSYRLYRYLLWYPLESSGLLVSFGILWYPIVSYDILWNLMHLCIVRICISIYVLCLCCVSMFCIYVLHVRVVSFHASMYPCIHVLSIYIAIYLCICICKHCIWN